METEALVVRGLTRTYGKRAAVKDLDLNVSRGDIYGFLGPNGAGKTTAMRCMLGLIKRNAGSVSIFGETNLVRAHRHIGAIIETPTFHGWLSGRRNLELSCAYAGLSGAAARKEIDRVLERVGLTERARDRAGGYSLGMKQRLAIARALLDQPQLLFLDEPTNGVDPRGMAELREFIRSLAVNDGITVFISSHLLSEVQALCNRVGIINHGTLRAEGIVDELLAAEQAVVEVESTDIAALRQLCQADDRIAILGEVGSRLRLQLNGIDTPALNKALVSQDVPVSALVPSRRNLEDLFLEVTQ